MSAILVAAPLRLEQALIRSGARGANVHHTGMGPVRSQAAAAALSRAPGAALMVLGFCGGLDAQSRPGEVVVAERVLAAGDEAHEPLAIDCDGAPALAAALVSEGLSVRTGTIVCVGRLALGERREELRRAGALAVDMESVWLGEGARTRPFAVVRVVLDSPSHELLRPQALVGVLRAARALRRTSAIALNAWGEEG